MRHVSWVLLKVAYTVEQLCPVSNKAPLPGQEADSEEEGAEAPV